MIFQAKNPVSLHVRRGDYITDLNANEYHGICKMSYYNDAINYLQYTVGGGSADLHLFVFSDDLEWCKENLKINLPITFVKYKRRDVGQVDMYLMSLCKHHIIANSSFSWWGAWLDPKPGKIVIAPQKWFKKKGVEDRDIVPEAWIKL